LTPLRPQPYGSRAHCLLLSGHILLFDRESPSFRPDPQHHIADRGLAKGKAVSKR
jgi:hypothetical protein